METIDLILSGLAIGAKKVASDVVTDAYKKLKTLVKQKLAGQDSAVKTLEKYEKNPSQNEARLREMLIESEADKDKEIIRLSKELDINIKSYQLSRNNIKVNGDVKGVTAQNISNSTINQGNIS